MARSDQQKGQGRGILLPKRAGRRSRLGGEVGGVGVLRCSVNLSPELTSAGDGGGRRCPRQSAEENSRESMSKDAQKNREGKGSGERAREVLASPEEVVDAGGLGGSPGVRVRGLGAGCSREWGQMEEGRPGFK